MKQTIYTLFVIAFLAIALLFVINGTYDRAVLALLGSTFIFFLMIEDYENKN